MRIISLILLLLLIAGVFNLRAQISVTADTTTGCDSLQVSFGLDPEDIYDTVTTISWDFGDGHTSGENSPIHLYKSPGLFSVSVEINNSFTHSETDLVSIHPSPDASFGYTDSLEVGSYSYVFRNVQQNPSTYSFQWKWNFENNGFETGQRTVLHTFPESGRYFVGLTVSNEYGCADTAARRVDVVDILEVPSVFSPNNDGYNDYFEVRTNGVNKYMFSVYTRSGNLVYRSESPVIFWDGRTFSGNILQPGTYYYVISQLDGEPRNEKKGFIHIFR